MDKKVSKAGDILPVWKLPDEHYCKDCGYPLRSNPCEVCHAQALKQESIHEEWRRLIGGDKAWYEYTKERYVLTQFNKQAYEGALRFDPLKGSALFWGPPGTGKSHLSAIIKRPLIMRGMKVMTVFMQDELRAAKSDFKKPHWVEDRIAPMVLAPVISIEDLGVEKPSEWVVNEWYYPIIEGRYRASRRGMIITMNVSLERLKDIWAPFEPPEGKGRVVSRLREMCKGNIYSLQGERDWREA